MIRSDSDARNQIQGSLFDDPGRDSTRLLQCGGRLREAIAEALKRCRRLDRFGVAAAMSRLTDSDVSKSSLDAWCAASRPDMRFPLELLPALIEATGSAEPLRVLAELCGFEIVGPQEHEVLELARLDARIEELERKREQLKPKTRRYLEEKGRR